MRRPRHILAALAAVALVLALAAAAAPAAPLISAQPGSLDFGLVNVDWGSQGQSVQIRNDGIADVHLGSAWIDGSSAFWLNGDGCAGGTLSPGATCGVNVGFDPSDGVPYAAALHVPSDAGDAVVSLSGSGGVQRVDATPETLDFGAVDVGAGATRALSLSNTGSFPFQAIVAIPTGSDVGAFRVVRDTCSLLRLDPGDGCELHVRFTPESAADASAQLMVIGGDSEPALVPLRGRGVAPPPAPSAPAAAPAGAAVAAPGALDFGVRRLGGVRVRPPRTLTVVNAGAGPLRIADVRLGGRDAGWFRIAGEECAGETIAPAGSCTVRVRFSPREAGAMSARLRIVPEAGGGSGAVASLSGRSVARPRR